MPNFIAATQGVSVQDWWFVYQHWAAVAERYERATGLDWPPENYVWKSGTVLSATETSITTGLAFCGGTDDVSGLTYDNPWGCATTVEISGIKATPDAWQIVIKCCDVPRDPRKIVISDITNWTNTGTINFSSIRDYVASGQIANAAELVGRPWQIEKQNGLTWADRTLPWTNARAIAAGTTTTTTATTLTDDKAKFDFAVIGKTLIVRRADNFLAQITVLAVLSQTTIQFASQSSLPNASSDYIIIASGAARPGRSGAYPFHFNDSNAQPYYGHLGDDTIGSVNLPADEFLMPGAGAFGGCDGQLVPSYDVDLYTGSVATISPDDVACGRPIDHYYVPDLYKNIHAIQQWTFEGLLSIGTWMERKSWEAAASFPYLTTATLGKKLGLNSFTTTIASVTGDNSVTFASLGVDYTPVECWWAIIEDTSDDRHRNGFGVINSRTDMSARSTTIPNFISPDDVGKTITFFLGPTRYEEYQFLRMHYKSVFIPDDDGVSAVDPSGVVDFAMSGCYGAGTWYRIAPSAKYIDYSYPQSTSVVGKGFAYEQGATFSDGDLARFVGDNAKMPSVRTPTGAFVSTAGPKNIYYDHAYNGKVRPSAQTEVDAQLHGFCSDDGSTTEIIDTTQHWYTSWYGGGEGKTVTFTVDSGNTTSFTASAIASGETNCYFDASHWVGFDSPAKSVVIDFLKSGTDFDDPAAVTESRPIDSLTPGTGHGTFVVPISFSTSGKKARIIFPRYEVNRFEGRTVTVIKPNGDGTFDSATSTLVANSDQRLYCSPALPWPTHKDMSYKIDDPTTGAVYRWDAGEQKWVKPTGRDTVRLGVATPREFSGDGRVIKPFLRKRYGYGLPGDLVTLSTFNEIQNALKQIIQIRHEMTFTNDPGTGAENNSIFADGGNDEDWPHPNNYCDPGPLPGCVVNCSPCGDCSTDVSAWWSLLWSSTGVADLPEPWSCNAGGSGVGYDLTLFAIPTTDAGNPTSQIGGNVAGCGATGVITNTYQYGVMTINQALCPFKYVPEMYAHAQIDVADDSEGSSCDVFGTDVHGNSYHFEPNGTGLLYRKFHQFFSGGQSTATVQYSSKLGSLTALAAPPVPITCTCDPDLSMTGSTVSAGYYVDRAWAILRFDFDGGLHYY